MALLQVFVARGCSICRRAVALADEVRARFPAVHVEVIDLADAPAGPPDSVVAVPTFVLDGAMVSLGNPRPSDFMQVLAARVPRAG